MEEKPRRTRAGAVREVLSLVSDSAGTAHDTARLQRKALAKDCCATTGHQLAWRRPGGHKGGGQGGRTDSGCDWQGQGSSGTGPEGTLGPGHHGAALGALAWLVGNRHEGNTCWHTGAGEPPGQAGKQWVKRQQTPQKKRTSFPWAEQSP